MKIKDIPAKLAKKLKEEWDEIVKSEKNPTVSPSESFSPTVFPSEEIDWEISPSLPESISLSLSPSVSPSVYPTIAPSYAFDPNYIKIKTYRPIEPKVKPLSEIKYTREYTRTVD